MDALSSLVSEGYLKKIYEKRKSNCFDSFYFILYLSDIKTF